MKIACRWFCAALAGLVLSGVARAQVAPYPEPELGSPEYTITVDDDGKAPAKAPEKIGPPKSSPEGAKKDDGAKKAAEGEPKSGGCCEEKSDGCCAKQEEKNGCADKKDENGCADKKEEEDECKNYCYLFGPTKAASLWDEAWSHCSDSCKPCFKMAGWLEGGYNSRLEPLSQTYGDTLSFNDVPNHFHARQCYLYAEKTVDTKKHCLDWGFRADAMYGTDAQKTQAFGNPPAASPKGWDAEWDNGVYGWALPQAYVDVGYGDLLVRAGHFYTLMGYETVTATGNFFFSHALTHFNSEPFTHTGAYAQYKVNDDLTVMAGWAAGWDTGFESFEGGSLFHGGFAAQLCKDVKFTYMNCIGDFGRRGQNAYYHSMVLDVKLCEKWQWVQESDVLRIDEASDGTPLGDDATSWVNYLFYNHSECLRFGVRAEWWKGNLPVPPYANPDFGSHYGFTYGINYKPHANLVIRPEFRHYWSPATDIRSEGFSVDAIFTF